MLISAQRECLDKERDSSAASKARLEVDDGRLGVWGEGVREACMTGRPTVSDQW